MFGFLAAPLIGGLISNLFNNNNNHHQHHCHGGHGGNSAATNFALAREDFKDAAQDFARGDFRGGMEELNEGLSRLGRGGHGGGCGHSASIDRALAREDLKDAAQDFARGDFRGGFEELREAGQHLADANRHRWI
jgi:hypothetical protein